MNIASASLIYNKLFDLFSGSRSIKKCKNFPCVGMPWNIFTKTCPNTSFTIHFRNRTRASGRVRVRFMKSRRSTLAAIANYKWNNLEFPINLPCTTLESRGRTFNIVDDRIMITNRQSFLYLNECNITEISNCLTMFKNTLFKLLTEVPTYDMIPPKLTSSFLLTDPATQGTIYLNEILWGAFKLG